MFLRTKEGIQRAPERKFLKSLFCKHKETIEGERCSELGLMRITGCDYYKICKKCGKIINVAHTEY